MGLGKKNLILKTILWRAFSFTTALISARMWFGNWSVSGFTIFITLLMMVLYYLFELCWDALNVG